MLNDAFSAMVFSPRLTVTDPPPDAEGTLNEKACGEPMCGVASLLNRMRSSAFAFYTVYVLAYALVMALQTGYTVHPLGLDWLGASTRMWGRTAVGVAIISAILFLDRFAELPGHELGGAARGVAA